MTDTMRALALALAAVLPLSGGCIRRTTVPGSASAPAPKSALMGEMDEIIAAMGSGQIDAVAGRMTARLKEELHEGVLAASAQDLKASFGDPKGILEEHLQQEGKLTWYSGLVLYSRRSQGNEIQTPVLYQVAFTPTRQIERLLIREHWFIGMLTHPASAYVPVTRLHVPAEGSWTVAQGGPTAELNAHHGSKTQRFAYDLVLVIDDRFRKPDADFTTNESYYGYGQPLRAPAAGEVVRVVDGIADNVPTETGEGGGNGVVIDHGFGERSFLWHARPGSLRVAEGDHVEPGQVVAEVGNSGRSSGAHIHMHVTREDEELALPAPLVDLVVDGMARDQASPTRGERIEAQLPMPDPAPAVARGPRVFLDV